MLVVAHDTGRYHSQETRGGRGRRRVTIRNDSGHSDGRWETKLAVGDERRTGPDSEATIVFLENAQAMAAHESPCTTKLYDRTGDEDEVERIAI